jgi:hypothetical protein
MPGLFYFHETLLALSFQAVTFQSETNSKENPMEQKKAEDAQARAALAEKQAALLNQLMLEAGIKNDAHLSRLVEMSPPVISKLRNGWLPIGATILIALNEVTGRSIRDMKQSLGYPVLARIAVPHEDVAHHPV